MKDKDFQYTVATHWLWDGHLAPQEASARGDQQLQYTVAAVSVGDGTLSALMTKSNGRQSDSGLERIWTTVRSAIRVGPSCQYQTRILHVHV